MKVGHDIETKRASWSFDGNVADTFVDHVRQSVPMYDAGHELVCAISDYFVRDDSTCYEIGTSTGQLLQKLATHHANKSQVRWIGIDPVEYRLPGVSQIQINVKAGLTFASALRSILRADPDVVMVGEIRDAETAKIRGVSPRRAVALSRT